MPVRSKINKRSSSIVNQTRDFGRLGGFPCETPTLFEANGQFPKGRILDADELYISQRHSTPFIQMFVSRGPINDPTDYFFAASHSSQSA